MVRHWENKHGVSIFENDNRILLTCELGEDDEYVEVFFNGRRELKRLLGIGYDELDRLTCYDLIKYWVSTKGMEYES